MTPLPASAPRLRELRALMARIEAGARRCNESDGHWLKLEAEAAEYPVLALGCPCSGDDTRCLGCCPVASVLAGPFGPIAVPALTRWSEAPIKRPGRGLSGMTVL